MQASQITRVVLALVACTGLTWHTAGAQDVEVPARVQVDLLNKVLAYDRSFAARSGKELSVIVLVKSGDADSERVGAQILGELRSRPSMGQLPHREELLRYTDPQQLAELCRTGHASVVYLSTGFGAEVTSIVDGLVGQRVLSVAAFGDDVRRGLVLGFGISSGKPKLLINLGRARSQGVDFHSDLLRIAQLVSP